MNKLTLSSSASLFVLASILFASSGCTEHVVGGVEPDGSADAGSTAVTSVAILGANMPEDKMGYLTKLAQIDVQPDSLYVFIGSFDEQCQSPFPPVCEVSKPDPGAPLEWQVVLGIPASLQQPGVLTIPQAGVDAIVSVGGSAPGADPNVGIGCAASGDALMGEVAIANIDATQVTLDFMGVQTSFYEPDGPPVITVHYETQRCP
jgi:hypothetical protein